MWSKKLRALDFFVVELEMMVERIEKVMRESEVIPRTMGLLSVKGRNHLM